MKRILPFLLLLVAISGHSQFYTATITLTNLPAGLSSNIVVNGVTRYWTNEPSASPSTLILQTNTIPLATTNLLNHLTLNPLSFPVQSLRQSNPSNIIIRSLTAMTITFGGGWASLVMVTNTTTNAVIVTMPITLHSATNQTNLGTWLAEALQFSSTSFKMHWDIMDQTAGLTNNNTFTGTNTFSNGSWSGGTFTGQRVTNVIALHGTNHSLYGGTYTAPTLVNVVTLSGTLGRTTNGYNTNGIFDGPITTNLVNNGNAISSPGAGTSSEQFGTGAQANGLNSFAAGKDAIADGINSFAAGTDAYNGGDSSVAVGIGVEIPAGVGATNVTVYGNSSSAGAPNSGAWGSFVTVSQYHTNSYGMGASTTETNQIMLWSSTHKVRIPGQLQVTGSMTNNFLTGSNRVGGSWSLTRRSEGGWPADHNIITNSANDNLVWLTAPAGGSTNIGFTGGYDGRVIEYTKYNGGYIMGIANESGSAPPEERVLTGTGADVNLTNSPGHFKLRYDGTLSRWILLEKSN